MNLFCFSLEGSMDSLYEPVQTPTGSQECNLTSRPCSPSPLLLDSTRWGGSQPCIATESSRMLKINSRKKKKKKENTTFPKLPLDCRAVVGLDSRDAYREIPADQADVSIQNRWNEVLAEGGAGLRRLRLDRMDPGPQEDRGALGVIQKLVRPTKGNHSSLEDTQGSAETADSPVVSCMGLAKKTETSVKEAQGRTPQGMWEGRAGGRLYATWDPRSHVTHQRWSTLSECSAPWDHTRHTCLGTLDLHHSRLRDFGLLRDGDHSTSQWEPFTGVRSVTDLDDIGDARSTSFGRFDAFRRSSPAKHDEDEAGGGDQGRTRVLGKMKAISLTMRGQMGRKYSKALSEERVSDQKPREQQMDIETEVDRGPPFEKDCRRSSTSLESLYSVNSGRSSSSGVTSGSDGSGNRESLRAEEDLLYTGPVCGRARVHTDFVPSPYDAESLRLKVGDVIDVLSKPPMGIWTGRLHNKVGNFKFIYVDLIEEQVGSVKAGTHRHSRVPAETTLEELLQSLQLEEYISSLLLNGYETVEDLKELKEQHLIELNVSDPEHRSRLLGAVDGLPHAEGGEEEEGEGGQKEETPASRLAAGSDCPRDSGCYVTPELSENSRDDVDGHNTVAERPPGASQGPDVSPEQTH
ncbi:SAM domain-containing protein SAMSN-1-like [Arapaima gigas]